MFAQQASLQACGTPYSWLTPCCTPGGYTLPPSTLPNTLGHHQLALGGTIPVPRAPLRKVPFAVSQMKRLFPSLAAVAPALTIKDGTKHFEEITYASLGYCAEGRDKTGTK